MNPRAACLLALAAISSASCQRPAPLPPPSCSSDADCVVAGQDEWERCEPQKPRTLIPQAHADAFGKYQDWHDCRCVSSACAFVKNDPGRIAAIAEGVRAVRAQHPECDDASVRQSSAHRFQEAGVARKASAGVRCEANGKVLNCSVELEPAGGGWVAAGSPNCSTPAATEK